MPEPPDHIREAARLAPDHWLGMVDPAVKQEGPPPEWAVLGHWRSDDSGNIVQWQANQEYRPSPRALGLPEPTDDVDAAVQLAATGYGPAEDVPRTLAAAEVAVFVQTDGRPVTAASPDGIAVVPVFTSTGYLQSAGRLASETMTVPALVERLPEGHQLYVNPSAPVAMRVELEPLLQAIEEASATGPLTA